jgi:hypothetical protein
MTFTVSELRGPGFSDPVLPDAAVAFPDDVPSAAATPAEPGSRPHAALHRLLGEFASLSPEYRAQLTNHLPMALHALDALGAGEARLRAFAARYVRRFEPAAAPPAGPAIRGDWTPLRGDYDAIERLRRRFAKDLAREGRDAVLRRVLPSLVDGIAAQAFHGPIRVAHAVEAGHDGELAAALAYWAARWQPMPVAPGPVPDDARFDDVGEWLDALDAAWRLDDVAPAVRLPLISARMAEATGTHAYRRLGGALRTRGRDAGDRLAELALAGAARYARSRDLTVLHMVTAARAARVLAPWLPAEDAVLAPLWHAVAAASLASGLAVPGAAPREPVIALRWPDLLERARRHDDDHVVKLVHALWTIDATRAHPDGARAATLAVRG